MLFKKHAKKMLQIVESVIMFNMLEYSTTLMEECRRDEYKTLRASEDFTRGNQCRFPRAHIRSETEVLSCKD